MLLEDGESSVVADAEEEARTVKDGSGDVLGTSELVGDALTEALDDADIDTTLAELDADAKPVCVAHELGVALGQADALELGAELTLADADAAELLLAE